MRKSKPDYIDELKEIINKFREQHKADGFSYFICAANGKHSNAFSSVDATPQEFIAMLTAAMRQNKAVEKAILWLAEHYKQLNKMVEDGIKHN